MAKSIQRMCPCHGQTLDRLVQPALLAFLRRRPASGYRLLQQLAQMPMFRDSPPNAAGVYRHLKDMERRGLLRGAWNLSATGPASRRFQLTATGRDCLKSWAHTLDEHYKNLAHLRKLLGRSAPRGR
jgi:PadR family transcriptional regulator, regulatory protein PadR